MSNCTQSKDWWGNFGCYWWKIASLDINYCPKMFIIDPKGTQNATFCCLLNYQSIFLHLRTHYEVIT